MSVSNSLSPAFCKVQVRFMLHDEIALGSGKIELLVAINETGSIAAAGRKMGMSYRRAWLLVETMNRCFMSPLVSSNKGGSHGGGAQLTELGQQVLTLYQELMAAIQQQTQDQQTALLKLLKPLETIDVLRVSHNQNINTP